MTKPDLQSPTLRDLYPDLVDEDLACAGENLDRYIDLVARITERIARDPEAMARYRSLTRADEIPTMRINPINPSDQ